VPNPSEPCAFGARCEPLLLLGLSAAVPLWIEQFRDLSPEERKKIAQEASALLQEKSEFILYLGKPGDSAAAFNALARAIAALAFHPGGVKVFGQHWQANPIDPQETPP